MVTYSNYNAQMLWSVCWSGGYPIELLNWDIGSEVVRCFLRLESLPYAADVKLAHCYVVSCKWRKQRGGKDGHVVISPISASCACPLRLGDALST